MGLYNYEWLDITENYQNMTPGDGSHIYCGKKTWLEGQAVEQFNRVLGFDGILKGVAFPDLHPGRGVPVGAAFLSENIIYPALIGNDIGCGMTLFDTGIPARKLKVDKFTRKLGDDPESVIQQLAKECSEEIPNRMYVYDVHNALGTLGHGNHFAEILELETVLDAEYCQQLAVAKGNALLLIHSGSRAYGEELWRDFAAKHGEEGVPAASEDGAAYLNEHAHLIQLASYNRRMVAYALARLLGCTLRELIDTTHNSIMPAAGKTKVCQLYIDGDHNNIIPAENGLYIHRKGASAVEEGKPVVVAGSRGTNSYLVKPVGNQNENLFSLAHGAGRKWNRQSTKARIHEKHDDASSLLQTKLGTKIICPDKDLLYEEAPEAYKDIEDIITDLESFGLAEPIARLKPIVNIKP